MPHVTAPISVNDGLSTPVSRSFAPRKLSMEDSIFTYARTAGDPKDALISLGVLWSDSTVKRPTVRQEASTVFPILRMVNGVQTVVSTARAVTLFIIPDVMTELEANDLNAFHLNFTGSSLVKNGRTIREPIWG